MTRTGQSDSDEASQLEAALARVAFRRLSIHLIYLKTVDSTQNYASTHLKSHREGDSIISEVQTAGKGREGRPWISPKGGLWMTIVIKPPAPRILERIVYIAANAVIHTLDQYGVSSAVYPPNDVYFQGKKVAGILADTVVQGDDSTVYLGVGINVNNDVSSDESISGVAISLSQILGRKVDLAGFTVAFLTQLDRIYYEDIESQTSHG